MGPFKKSDTGLAAGHYESSKSEAAESVPFIQHVGPEANRPRVIPRVTPVIAVAAWILVSAICLITVRMGLTTNHNPPTCDTISSGYQCDPEISHFWGQYSPYFGVPSTISGEVPSGCEITFAQILSRHGARDPTKYKSMLYRDTISRIHSTVNTYPGEYSFLAGYRYTLGEDQLTSFGEQQMINSGMKFYTRYHRLAQQVTPFVRSSSQHRVVKSAQKWAEGFHHAKLADKANRDGDSDYPYSVLKLTEAIDSNNTLSHGLCRNFETGPDHLIGLHAKSKWAHIFLPPIQDRINSRLRGANLKPADVMVLMDLCPYETVASPHGFISPFCSLFTEEEWHQYDYYQSLGKYYGYGDGNPLGPVQGFGFANELIARLTGRPVDDQTSTNHTLDDDPATFPLQSQLYADFSHDNDMTMMFSALRLYDGTSPLSNRTRHEAPETDGYSAAWTVPFAARAYFEKLRCHGHEDELVRVLINDRVLPLKQCGGDLLGRCTLTAFVQSLSHTTRRGEWDKCFA